MAAAKGIQRLKATYPFLQTPLIISAPMRVFAGPDLAVATSQAGGLGFIGPGVRPTDLANKLERAKQLLQQVPATNSNPVLNSLPIGVGFQLFDGDLGIATATVKKYRPAAAWLFVPGNGQQDVDRWTQEIREACNDTQIWLQVGSVSEAIEAAKSQHAPDVLVLQGIDAGGHGLKKGAGVISLLPEVADALAKLHKDIPLIGAGGLADGRGVAAVLATGVAAGVVMGTRFLASQEAEIKKGYQDDVIRLSDGGQTTVRTVLFDKLQGRDDWPEQYDGRAIINDSVKDEASGMPLAENKKLFQDLLKAGTEGWGEKGRLTSYVGSAIGLIRSVEPAGHIIAKIRAEAKQALKDAANSLID